MRQPQSRAIGRPAQAVTLCRGRGWRQGGQTDIIIPDMGIGASIGHLMILSTGQGAHGRSIRFQELRVLIKFRHASVLLPVAPAMVRGLARVGLTDWCFGKVDAKTALIIFSHCRAFNFVAFI